MTATAAETFEATIEQGFTNVRRATLGAAIQLVGSLSEIAEIYRWDSTRTLAEAQKAIAAFRDDTAYEPTP